MLISQRMANLLEKAAICFDDGANPFQREWLVDNEVTFEECEHLSELIGAALYNLLQSTDQQPIETIDA